MRARHRASSAATPNRCTRRDGWRCCCRASPANSPNRRPKCSARTLNIALDADGQPTRALQGFAQKAGVDWTQLARTTDDKGERFVHRAVSRARRPPTLLPEILREAIAAMPIPKPMRWGEHDYAFARPVHWLVLLLGGDVVDGDVLGVTRRAAISRGHRFLHDKPVWIDAPGDYVDALRGAKVLVDPDERRERIVREVEAAADAAGGVARMTPATSSRSRAWSNGRARCCAVSTATSSPCRRKR